MSFLGSKKFPRSNHWDRFLKAHGGTTNAHTDLEETVYYFDVDSKHLPKALEIFSSAISEPLLDKHAVQKELNLINAEFMLAKYDDESRFEQLLGSTAVQGHPMRRFSWGDARSLKTTPEEQNNNVHQSMIKFHEDYYIAKNMTLAVISTDSLNVLEDLVVKNFGGMPFSSKKRPSFAHHGLPFATPEFHQYFKVVPVKHMRCVQLTWPLESQHANYLTKPLRYISELVCHKGPGSLLAALRTRNWATDIGSGEDHSNSTWSQFSVRIDLTNDGLSNMAEVISLVFQYLTLLRTNGVDLRFWKEMNSNGFNEFLYAEPEDNLIYARHMSSNIRKYHVKDLIMGRKTIRFFDPKLIRECLEKLRPQNINMTAWSKSFEVETIKWEQEPWFDTLFNAEAFAPEWIQQWSSDDIALELRLPQPNRFLATDLSLLPADMSSTDSDQPLSSTDVSRLWHVSGANYRSPKGFIGFCLRSDLVDLPTTNICLLDLYTLAVEHLTRSTAHLGQLAHLSFTIEAMTCGITLEFYGFNHKLKSFFTEICQAISSFSLTDAIFNEVLSELMDKYRNVTLSPEDLAKDLRSAILKTNCKSASQKLESLMVVTKEQLVKFAAEIYNGAYVDGLIHGNLSVNDAKDFEASLLATLNVKPSVDSKSLYKVRMTKLDVGMSAYIASNSIPGDDNNAILNCYQLGAKEQTTRERLIAEILIDNMQEEYFDQLRTNLQLAYTLSAKHSVVFGVSSLTMVLLSQSSRFRVDHLDYFLERFLQDYNNLIQSMTPKEFKKLIAGRVREEGGDGAKGLLAEAEAVWNDVVEQRFFSQDEDKDKELKVLTLDDVKKWSDRHFKPNDLQKKLSIQIMGARPKMENGSQKMKKTKSKKQTKGTKSLSCQRIADIDAFKSTCSMYTYDKWQ